MTREEYVEHHLLKLFHTWTNFTILSGITIILVLAFLDLSVTPENFKTFLIYRIATATIFILIYIYNKKVISLKRLILSTLTGAISVSSMVALMIARYGGHASPYFGGVIVILIFLIAVCPPIRSRETLTGILYALIIYSLYIIPIIIYDKVTNMAFFVNANFFILASAASMSVLRHFIIKRLKNELSLQYDLEQQKQRLSLYTAELEKDVTQGKRALKNSEIRFMELFENANDGIVVMNRDGIIIDANKRFSEIIGFDRDSLIGTNIKIFEANSDDKESIMRKERLLKGESVIFEMEHFRRDGEKIELEVSSKVININGDAYIQSFYRDITEKKRLQSQLFQTQKMESMGILAGSIAHDFDNIITAINGNIEMFKSHNNLDDFGRQRINLIENSIKRAKHLIAGLLSFTKTSNYKIRTVDLNNVIEETIELMATMIKKKQIEVILQLNENVTVRGDNNQLSQVIMNLTINAIEAMPSGGKITISTSIHKLEKKSFDSILESGDYALLKFTDTGIGISPEIKERIFDPFFTTKKNGRGTGLGLSIVYRIIKEHGGTIAVESLPGSGTTFTIYLPLAKNDKIGQERPENYKILIVDDETEIVEFIKELLKSQGYTVMSLNNPLDAQKMGKEIKEIDLLITDIIMPNLNGKELIRYFKSINPSIKVIAISAHDIWNIGKRDSDIDVFVSKPFEGLYLLSVIKRVLNFDNLKIPD